MIRRLAIAGYKSLRDAEVPLEPLTVVIGPNAAGKSNLLDAIGLLSRTAEGDLQSAFDDHRGGPLQSFTFGEHGFEGLLKKEHATFRIEADIELSEATVEGVNRTITEARVGHDPARALVRERLLRYTLEVRLRIGSGIMQVVDESLLALNRNLTPKQSRSPFLSIENTPRGKKLSLRLERQSHPFEYETGMGRTAVSLPLYAPHHPHLAALRHELASWQTYYLEPEAMRRDAPRRVVERLPHDGSDLAAFYNTMEQEHPATFEGMNRALRAVLPGIERVGVSSIAGTGRLRLHVVENGVRFEASALSEGTLRILALIGITNSPAPASVVGYEEPENGVHPARLQWIAALLEEAARDGDTQFILNTHSARFPTMFSADRTLVLGCSKRGGVTTFQRIERLPMLEEQDMETALEDQPLAASSLAERIERGDFS